MVSRSGRGSLAAAFLLSRHHYHHHHAATTSVLRAATRAVVQNASEVHWRLLCSSSNYHAVASRDIHPISIIRDDDGRSNKNNPKDTAEYAFTVLASRHRSWKRLEPMVDLVLKSAAASEGMPTTKHQGDHTDDTTTNNSLDKPLSVVDIGTDHGLLALALAQSLNQSTVVGVDVSPRALQGAIDLQCKIKQYLKDDSAQGAELNWVDFCVGNGLQAIQQQHPGEADVVCIAGMGVNTMLDILLQDQQSCGSSNDDNVHAKVDPARSGSSNLLLLDVLRTKHIVLQPTNSRPKNLMRLYQTLQDNGWQLSDESIEFLSSRWYLTMRWDRLSLGSSASATSENRHPRQLPGSCLLLDERKRNSASERKIFNDYVKHHIAWQRKDQVQSAGRSRACKGELEWMEHFQGKWH